MHKKKSTAISKFGHAKDIGVKAGMIPRPPIAGARHPKVQGTNSVKKPPLQPKIISRSLPMALLRARELFMSRFRPMLAQHNVSEQQWRVLRVLNEERFLDASELAKRAAILAPSLTRIIKALKAMQLIQTGQFDRDGRRVLIAISPAGVQLIRDILPESLAIYAEFDERFGSEKLEQLLNLLDELLKMPAEDSTESETLVKRGAKNKKPASKVRR